jgi:hypothetical protein
MFKNVLKQFMSIFMPSKHEVPKDGLMNIYGRVIEHGEDFFYPKKFTGIPVIDVQSILKDYQPQLDKIKQHAEIGDQRKTPDGNSLYDSIYTSVIERYVEFCHMIPASEDHHHSHIGGLLLHSLEASVDSLRWAKETRRKSCEYDDFDVQVNQVINYCVWLAALLHDAGKLINDITVDAVEIYNPKTRQQGPVTESILSWYPAKESLIDWAKRHNVTSYSVNFLSNRIHNRHNVDSSQILQQVLHNHYAMDYLLSTPIKQEVYSDLISVLSGDSTSEDFLSEAVRMGDAVSTSRSLVDLYDAKLGLRSMSTVQRFNRSIRHAAKDWRWNQLDGQGWILGGDVFIRWSSCIKDIIKISAQLGYNLPVDVNNVLKIMEFNHINDLFDNSSKDDRIVRFTPGEFNHQELMDIQLGKTEVRWFDLLKLRGPEMIFDDSPIPFSKSGLFYLPIAEVFYSITQDGLLTKLPPVTENITVMRKLGDKKQKCLMDNTRLETGGGSYTQTGLSNCSEEHIGKQSSTSDVALEQSQQQVSNFDFEKTHSTYISKELDIALFKLFSLSTTFPINNQLYLNIDSASMLTKKTRFTILEFLEFKGYMLIDSEISLEQHIKYLSYQGKQCLGILLSMQCIRDAFGFNKALEYTNPEVFVPEPAGSLDDPHSTDNQQLNFLIESSDKNSLIKYLSAQDLLHYITESGLDGFYFCVEEMQADNSKKLNLSRLRSYFRDRPFPFSSKGYLLSADELSKIQLFEVTFDD